MYCKNLHNEEFMYLNLYQLYLFIQNGFEDKNVLYFPDYIPLII